MAENQENLPAVAPEMEIDDRGAVIPTNYQGALELCRMMSIGGLVPSDCANKPAAVFVRVQYGAEVGLGPWQSVQSVTSINGRPAIWGDAMLGLVQKSGKLEDFEERIEGEGENMTAICIVKRTDRKTPATQTFSIADARTAGLLSKSGPWKQYPKRMLQMRARSWALRDTFPDVLKGLVAHEEAEDIIDVTPTQAGEYEAQPAAEPAPKTETPKAEPAIDAVAEFDRFIREDFGLADDPLFPVFVEKAAEANGLSIDAMKAEAVSGNDVGALVSGFEQWKAKQKAKTTTVDQAKAETPKAVSSDEQPDMNGAVDFRAEWIRLKKAGFSTFVHKNLERFKNAPAALLDEARGKWKFLYDPEPWPLDPKPAEQSTVQSGGPAEQSAEILTTGGGLKVRKSDLTDELLNSIEWAEMMDWANTRPDVFNKAAEGMIFEDYADVEYVTKLCKGGAPSTETDGIPQG